MSNILIVPVMLESDMIQNQDEDMKHPSTLEADFYPLMINQLTNIFTKSAIVTTISLQDALVIDQYSAVNSNLLNKTRNQWNSENVLKWISMNALQHTNNDTKILAMCDFDAYSNDLNFVFGEAQLGGRVGAIYLPRLSQEFYGHIADTGLLQKRVVKEMVHESGHLFGLSHCEKRNCVMYFSNSLKDTDFKDNDFCDRCEYFLTADNML